MNNTEDWNLDKRIQLMQALIPEYDTHKKRPRILVGTFELRDTMQKNGRLIPMAKRGKEIKQQ